MREKITRVYVYALLVAIALGVYAWAGFTGTHLLGDDNETVDNASYSSAGHSGSGGRGYSRFYHK